MTRHRAKDPRHALPNVEDKARELMAIVAGLQEAEDEQDIANQVKKVVVDIVNRICESHERRGHAVQVSGIGYRICNGIAELEAKMGSWFRGALQE
eukprot:7295052-Pyramimonas_sp.AAC.1